MSSWQEIDPRSVKVVLSPPEAWWSEVPVDYVATSYEEMMWPAIKAAEANMPCKDCEASQQRLGGPFGAATYLPREVVLPNQEIVNFTDIEDRAVLETLRLKSVQSWDLLSLGANLVVEQGQADYHAEILAGRLASVRLAMVDTHKAYNFWHRFVVFVGTSAPCEMCQHYFSWSTPRGVIAGTRVADTVRELKFHEGKSPDAIASLQNNSLSTSTESWTTFLQQRGIEVVDGILRDEVVNRLFRNYAGVIYNAGKSDW